MGWTFAFDSYFELNITQYVDSKALTEMSTIVDPYCELAVSDQASAMHPFLCRLFGSICEDENSTDTIHW